MYVLADVPDVQPDALTRLRTLGATVVPESPPGTGVRSVTFPHGRITPQIVQQLLELGPVRSISFDGCPQVDDSFMPVIAQVEGLESLNLGGTPITDRGLKQLRPLRGLRRIYLWRTDVTEEGLAALSSLPNLQLLNLWDTATTDQLTELLAAGFPSLKKVYLGSSPQPKTVFHTEWTAPTSTVSPKAVAKLKSARPSLQIIYWDVTDAPEAPSVPPASNSRTEIKVMRATGEAARAALKPETPADWNGFLGPTADGSADKRIAAPNWTLLKPQLLWQRSVGRGLSAPTSACGVVVFSERSGNEERVICLNSENGAERWTATLPTSYVDALGYDDGPRSTPAIADGHVYAVSAEGLLMCLTLDTGDVVWTCPTASRFESKNNLYGVGSSPVIYQDLILLAVGGTDKSQRPPVPAGIVAFDRRTGAVRYTLSSTTASYSTIRIALLRGKWTGLAFMREGLVAFDPLRGRELGFLPWAARISGCVNASTPIVTRERVFISEAYGPGSALCELNDDGFEIDWRDPERSRIRAFRAHWATPVLYKGHLYGCSGRFSSEGEIRCVELRSGRLLWRHRQRGMSSVCRIGDTIVNLTEHGALELFRASPDGWESLGQFLPDVSGRHNLLATDHMLKYPVWVAPVVTENSLLVRGSDRLAAFRHD